MTVWMVSSLLVLFLCFSAIHAQLTISTSTPTPCYGDVVTLVCHHPELANNSQTRYYTTTPQWRENGDKITPSTGIYLKPDTSEDLTHTTLPINITVDHFRNKSFNYSCELVLADEDGEASGSEKSEEVTVDPVDLTPPHITNMDPLESSITVRLTPQPCAVRYRVSWMYTNDDGTTTTGSGVPDQVTNYTIPTSVQGVYTVSVQAVDGVGNVGPATSEVVRSTYPQPTADAPPCEDRPLVLTCLVSGLHNDRRSRFIWMDGNGPLDTSDQYSITGDQLMIASVSALSGEEDKAIRCCEVLSNGIIVEGVEYNVEPKAQPDPPEVTITTTDFTITLTWDTALRCFESEMFTFVVIWNEIGSGTSTNVTTSSSPYTISGLQPGTSYQISVHGVDGSGVVGGIRVLNVTTSTTPPTGGGSSIAIGVSIAVAVLVLTCAVVVILIACVVWKYRRSRKVFSKKSEQPESGSPTAMERVVIGQGGVPPIRDQPQTASQRTTTNYADLDFTGDRPVPPPSSLEKVTYTEVENKPSKDVDASPELPPKQDQQQIKAFRDYVKAVLDKNGVICKDLQNTEELKGIKRENAFTAEYNGIHFVAICVHTSSDLTISQVHMVTEARHLTWVKVGLLISNQSTIPSECLLTLEDGGCEFVPVGGYGEEGWEDRMIDKFKDVFSKEANDDSESEDLPTSEQETSHPSNDHNESEDLQISEQVVDSSPIVQSECSPPPTSPPDNDSKPPADPFRSQSHGDIDHTQAGPVVGSFTSTFDYLLEDDTVPLIE